MGRTKQNESDTSGSTLADDTGVDPEKETVEATDVKVTPKAKAKRTRLFRGQDCEIIKTTKNTSTGAVYDLILYKRNVTNRRTGEAKDVFVGHKLRREGTGVVSANREIEIEQEVEE
jgi:hypothetical protein